jgi:hypothetical protein
MPFSKRPDNIFDGFRDTIRATQKPVSIQAQGISGPQIGSYPYPQFTITTDGADRPINPIVTKISLLANGAEVATLTRPELKEFFSFVETNTDSNYRNVKTNTLWRVVYCVQPLDFFKFDSKLNQTSRVKLEATYCQKCGINLPLRNLTIDHQKPQQGGDIEAMLRVFRAAGLTVSTGSGQKNRYIQGQVAKSVGGNVNVLPRGQKGSDLDRYTFNDKGIIYFTMLQFYGLTDQMRQMSMHHVVNLRPMCGPCNSALRNTNITWLWA